MSNGDDIAKRQRELDNARYLKRQYETQLDSYKSRYNSNNEKLERIRKAKKSISEIKENLEERSNLQKDHAENADTYYEWNGNSKNNVYNMYCETTSEEYKYYIKSIDNLLDSIVDIEIRYENDNMEMLGLIGKVGGWINSLAGEIEKLLN